MYICIEGNIGAGKTTLAVALAKRRKAFFLAEEFEDNPLLPLFYTNKKTMAFPLEYSFLISRHAQLHKHFNKENKRITVADFSLHKCLWFAESNLSGSEFELYKVQFGVIAEVTKKPDLLIYINTHHKNLLENIKKRGRSYEKGIDKKYLQSVNKSYEAGLKNLKNIPVIEISVNKYKNKTYETIVNLLDDILKKGIKFKYKKFEI
jgi:deoxyadenosine/deoxycytidine kinase